MLLQRGQDAPRPDGNAQGGGAGLPLGNRPAEKAEEFLQELKL
jgi:hypothetical protein